MTRSAYLIVLPISGNRFMESGQWRGKWNIHMVGSNLKPNYWHMLGSGTSPFSHIQATLLWRMSGISNNLEKFAHGKFSWQDWCHLSPVCWRCALSWIWHLVWNRRVTETKRCFVLCSVYLLSHICVIKFRIKPYLLKPGGRICTNALMFSLS